MGDSGHIVQAIQNLRDADFARTTDLRRTEIPRGQRSLKPHFQDHGFDHLIDIAHVDNLFKVARCTPAARMNLLRQGRANILDHLRGEVGSKEVRQQESRQVH